MAPTAQRIIACKALFAKTEEEGHSEEAVVDLRILVHLILDK